MVRQKHRWTTDEEEALIAGVGKYGQGKWKLILSDPQFASCLSDRSNIDLKDKWRNMNVSGGGSSSRNSVRTSMIKWVTSNPPLSSSEPSAAAPLLEYGRKAGPSRNGGGSSSRNSVRTPMIEWATSNAPLSSLEPSAAPLLLEYGGKAGPSRSGGGSSSRNSVRTSMIEWVTSNPPLSYPEPSADPLLLEYGGKAGPSRSSPDTTTSPDYKAVIFEALSSFEVPNGLDISDILNFIENKYEVPENFRKSLTLELRELVLAGEVHKVNNCYKLKGASPGAETSQQEDVVPISVVPLSIDDRAEEQNTTPIPTETAEENPTETAEEKAARLVAEAEHLDELAIEACKKRDMLEGLLEESMVMLMLAEEIYEQCSRDGIVVLKP